MEELGRALQAPGGGDFPHPLRTAAAILGQEASGGADENCGFSMFAVGLEARSVIQMARPWGRGRENRPIVSRKRYDLCIGRQPSRAGSRWVDEVYPYRKFCGTSFLRYSL